MLPSRVSDQIIAAVTSEGGQFAIRDDADDQVFLCAWTVCTT